MENKSNKRIELVMNHTIKHTHHYLNYSEKKKYFPNFVTLKPKERNDRFFNQIQEDVTCEYCGWPVTLDITQMTVAIIPRESVNKIFNSEEEIAIEAKKAIIKPYDFNKFLKYLSCSFVIISILLLLAIGILEGNVQIDANFLIFPAIITLIIVLPIISIDSLNRKKKLHQKNPNREAVIKICNHNMFDYLFSFTNVKKMTFITRVSTTLPHYICAGVKHVSSSEIDITFDPNENIPYSDELSKYMKTGFLED